METLQTKQQIYPLVQIKQILILFYYMFFIVSFTRCTLYLFVSTFGTLYATLKEPAKSFTIYQKIVFDK